MELLISICAVIFGAIAIVIPGLIGFTLIADLFNELEK